MMRTGRISRRKLASMAATFYLLYRSNRLDYEQLIAATGRYFRGVLEQEANEFGQEVYRLYIRRKLFRGALAHIQWHRVHGHEIALLSSTPFMLAKPMADDLGIRHLLVNFPVVVNGRFTGELVKPYCYGEGKKIYAEQLAKKLGTTLQKAYFYTDSISDLPLLKAVGQPICVNPDYMLKKEAKKHGWRKLYFRQTIGSSPLRNPLAFFS